MSLTPKQATDELVEILNAQIDGYENDREAAADWASVIGTKYDAERVIVRLRIAAGRAA